MCVCVCRSLSVCMLILSSPSNPASHKTVSAMAVVTARHRVRLVCCCLSFVWTTLSIRYSSLLFTRYAF